MWRKRKIRRGGKVLRYYKIDQLVGRTPILLWNQIYLKMEMFNPSGSIKDRPAQFMLERLLKNGIIQVGDTIICPTSGNMGISLAYFGSLYQVRVVIVMPENMTEERKTKIRALGAKLILTKANGGMAEAVKKAQQEAKEQGYYYFDQFAHELNVLAHYYTAKEILEDLPDVEYIVCGIGTGGTCLGITKLCKRYYQAVKVIAFEPEEVNVISKRIFSIEKPTNQIKQEASIPGIGSNFIPTLVEKNLHDIEEIRTVNSEKVRVLWKYLNQIGLKIGISGAAAYMVASQIKEENPESKVLAIIPDGYDRYSDCIV